ncbi:carboxymuconolactone decarboxylase family protein [Pseudomonas sp. TH31]|uniref:carboxymuconolactone decarboxylase family protein n=1 Tax=Pseudomonas sp. TH31 TaxID=2796396 RepID=UPI001F5BBEB2|nr:carboxymuconolactone decarboxylase family protein [Pseudomonas sp. TH31]
MLLLELVYLRISEINGCAFCLGKHSQTLRECEVQQEKLDCLAGWRISELFNDRERAGMAWHGMADTHSPTSAKMARQTSYMSR